MIATKEIIKINTKNKEDYEFYPTTMEIIEALYWDIVEKIPNDYTGRLEQKSVSLLDVGAGNCKVYTTLQEIAKEQPLLDQYVYYPIKNEEYLSSLTLIEVLDCIKTSNGFRWDVKTNGGIKQALEFAQIMLMNCALNLKFVDKEIVFYGNKKGTVKELFMSQALSHRRQAYYRAAYEQKANKLQINKYMVIEKSQTLLNAMPREAIVVGTDFNENTLIDKQVDIVFCNPPYSEFAKWSEKIIREANAKTVYLVIPKRWGKNRGIIQAIKDRKATVVKVGSFDFLNSEDRKARAFVDLVKVDMEVKDKYFYERGCKVDPFDLWFSKTFKIQADKTEDLDKWRKEREVKNQLVNAEDKVALLVDLYNNELNHLINNYQKLGELDSSLLKELNINLKSLLKAFKEKIKGLKNFYWERVFDELDEIKNRLTSRSRDALFRKLAENTNIDFTENNIGNIVIWIIKNANHYFDEQMLEVYDDFTTPEGIHLYKSNQKWVDDEWRYNKNNLKGKKYTLDYRIILHGYRDSWVGDEDKFPTAQKRYVEDIIIIAKNLGFNVNDSYLDLYIGRKEEIWLYTPNNRVLKIGEKTINGKIEEIFCHTKTPNENGEDVMVKNGITYVYNPKQTEDDYYQYKINGEYYRSVLLPEDLFMTVKGFKNGNVHFQFNKKFIAKFNLEVSRLRGWVKSPKEASEEFDISVEEATEYWNSNFTLLPSKMSNLLPNYSDKPKASEESENLPLDCRDFENTPDFDVFDWWRTSASYEDLKEGDLLQIISEVDFAVIRVENQYKLIDKQDAYLGDIDKEVFDSILDCAKRLEDTYFRDYFGSKFDFMCSCCGEVVTEDDYAFEAHDGTMLCDACAVMCECCGKYYTESEGSRIDGIFTCDKCSEKIKSNKKEKTLFDFAA